MGDEQLRRRERDARAEGAPLPIAEFLRRRQKPPIRIPGDPASLKKLHYNITQYSHTRRLSGTAPAFYAKRMDRPIAWRQFPDWGHAEWRCYHEHTSAKAAWRCCRREAYKQEIERLKKLR